MSNYNSNNSILHILAFGLLLQQTYRWFFSKGYWLFLYSGRGRYKYVGENYLYTGYVYHKPRGESKEKIVGRWENGRYISKRK
ncbi:MAG: DUF7225 domain-containing protein [Oscillospiraceae bacterium]